MNRINFNRLYYFYIVAKEGSIKAAGNKLNLSPPSISIQIKNLEEEIGFKVFSREYRKLILTDKGRILLKHAESLFLLADSIIAELPEMGTMQKKEFKIGTLQTLSSVFINIFSINLWRDDLISTSIIPGSSESLSLGLDSSEFDLIITDEPSKQSNQYTSVNLGSDILIAVGTKEFSNLIPQFPNSLHKAPYLSFLNDGRLQSEINYFFSLKEIHPEIIGNINDVTLMKKITESGICFSILPSEAVKIHLKSERFIEIGQFKNIKFNLWAVFPKFSENSILIKKVLNTYLDRDQIKLPD